MTKNLLSLIGIFAIATLISSCSKDYGCTDPFATNYDPGAEDDCCCYYGPSANDNVKISSAISSDTQWTNDNVYELDGRISVESGATLTIQEGTIIKGQAGSGPNASALLVARGARIIAEGTSELPIIFTSVADEINQLLTPMDSMVGLTQLTRRELVFLGTSQFAMVEVISEAEMRLMD